MFRTKPLRPLPLLSMTWPWTYWVPVFGALSTHGTRLLPPQLMGGVFTPLERNTYGAGVGVGVKAGVGVAAGWPVLVSVICASEETRPSVLATSPPFTTLTVPGVMPPGPAVFHF